MAKKFEAEKTEFATELLLQKKQEYFIKFVEGLKQKAQSSQLLTLIAATGH